MIRDETLERLLQEAAADLDPPEHGPANVLAAARRHPGARLARVAAEPRRGRRGRPLASAAALVVVSAVGGALLTSSLEPRPQPAPAAARGAARSAAEAPTAAGSGTAAAGRLTPNGGSSASKDALSLQMSQSARAPLLAGEKPATAPAPPADGARIVKTGTVALEVAKRQVSPTLDRLTTLAAARGGYVAGSTTNEGSSTPSGSVRLRVPAASFELTLKEVRGYGTVQSVSATGRDVTAAYVDLAARLRALQSTRTTYLTLLSRARTIGETLAVQQQVDGVQQQIESLEGQRKVLADSSDLATLDVRVAEKGTAVALAPPREQSGLERAFDRALHGFARGVYAIVAASGPALLLLLCLLALLGMSWVGYRTLRRRLV